MSQYYVYITNGDAPIYLYEGRSEKQADYYTKTAISLMENVKGTGHVNYFNADSMGVRRFDNGEEYL
jgi:hypothetical protein